MQYPGGGGLPRAIYQIARVLCMQEYRGPWPPETRNQAAKTRGPEVRTGAPDKHKSSSQRDAGPLEPSRGKS